jgi:uncharacterized protein YeeX (DUF496 family)
MIKHQMNPKYWIGPYGMKVPMNYMSVPHKDGINIRTVDRTMTSMSNKNSRQLSRLEYLTKYAYYDDETGEYWYPRPEVRLMTLSGKDLNQERKIAISIEQPEDNSGILYIMFTNGNQHRYWARINFKPQMNSQQISYEPDTIPDDMKNHTTYVTNYLSLGDVKCMIETTKSQHTSDIPKFIVAFREIIEKKENIKRDIAKMREELQKTN